MRRDFPYVNWRVNATTMPRTSPGRRAERGSLPGRSREASSWPAITRLAIPLTWRCGISDGALLPRAGGDSTMSESSASGPVHNVERTRRLEADQRLVAAVQKSGRDSTESRKLQLALADLVVGTLTNLSIRGTLLNEVKRQCGVSLPAPPPAWREDSRQVIYMSAAMAIPRFINDFVFGGRWSQDRGSSVATTAVRAGLYAFINEYRTYLREEAERAGTEPIGALPEDFSELAASFDAVGRSRSPDPERVAVNRDLIDRTLRGMDSRTQTILLLMSDGWTQSEIGRELEMHPEAVSSVVRRARHSMRAPGRAAQ